MSRARDPMGISCPCRRPLLDAMLVHRRDCWVYPIVGLARLPWDRKWRLHPRGMAQIDRPPVPLDQPQRVVGQEMAPGQQGKPLFGSFVQCDPLTDSRTFISSSPAHSPSTALFTSSPSSSFLQHTTSSYTFPFSGPYTRSTPTCSSTSAKRHAVSSRGHTIKRQGGKSEVSPELSGHGA